MKILPLKLVRDLVELRAQVFTLAVLVICGASVLISSWSSYEALKVAQSSFYEKYHFADIFADFKKSPSDIVQKFNRISGIEFIEGRVITDALMDIPGQREPAAGRFISWHPQQILNGIYLREGRLPQKGPSFEAVVHESFAKAHNLHVGDRVTVLFSGIKTNVEISGIGISPEYIYALSPITIFPDDKHFGIFWMLESDLMQLAQMQGSYNNIVAKVAAGESLGRIKLEIDGIINPFGSLGSIDRTKQLSHVFTTDEIRQQKSTAAIIPAIFVLVGSFILNIVMNRLIQLHRGQISILKGLGYTSFELSFYYFKLVTIILILGFLPSIILAQGIGQWYANLYERYFRFPAISFSLTKDALILGALFSFLPGWFASLRALFKVFQLLPAEGMRPPSPPSFHQSGLERLKILNLNSILDRIAIRDLLFRPLRTIAAVSGIAMATGILVNGTFWMDIMDFMMQRQFSEMSREDIEIRLLKPRPKDIINEIQKIKGIIKVEAQRSIPVRMKFKHFEQDTVVLASVGEASMRRIVRRDGSEMKPPPAGVLLSIYFQKKFGIKVGDLLEFQVLQGNKQIFQKQVVGFVDDIIGASVYIKYENINEMLGEEGLIDSIFVRIIPDFKENIYISLKEFPTVASVSVKKIFIESFQKMTTEMIQIFTLILISFAVSIAGAVIFNVIRITFSEKTWELTSLRVFGFHTKEVFQILFEQIGIQVLISIIPGLLIGYGFSYLSTYWIHSETFIFPLVVEVRTYAFAVFIVLMTSMLGSLYLLQKVDALKLSEALKSRE